MDIDEKIRVLSPFLVSMDDSALSELKSRLNRGNVSAYDIFFKPNISDEQRTEIDFKLKYWQVEFLFAARITEVQRELLIKYNLIHFNWINGEFSFEDLSERLRFGYLNENIDPQEHTFSSDREIFHMEFRKLFHEYGEDVKPSDIFSRQDLMSIEEIARRGNPSIDNLNQIVSEELQHPPLKESQKPISTALGMVAWWMGQKILMGKRYNLPIRKLMPDYYYEPNTYNRIVRDYYDLTCGFISVTNELLQHGRVVFRNLGILPQYGISQWYQGYKYPDFCNYLIESGILTLDQIHKVEHYYFTEVEKAFEKVSDKLHLFVFIVALLLKQDYLPTYKLYHKNILKLLDHLGQLYIELSKDNLGAGKKENIKFEMDCLCNDHLRLCDNNLLYFCVYYDVLFDAKVHLRQKLPQFRRAQAAINNLLVYLVRCLAPDGNIKKTLNVNEFGFMKKTGKSSRRMYRVPTPLNIAHAYIELLTGVHLKAPLKRYNDWQKKYQAKLF